MKRKKLLRLFSAALILILLAALAVCFFYWPRSLSSEKYDACARESDELRLRVMSYNIRWSASDFGHKSWFYRSVSVMDRVREASPDIAGFQEVTALQYSLLKSRLTGCDSVAQRAKGGNPDYCPIFYRTDRFELAASGSFWLSETPDSASRLSGASMNAVCTYAVLIEKATGEQFAVFNTRLDPESADIRAAQAAILKTRISELGYLSILLCDLGSPETSDAYAALRGMRDAALEAPDTQTSCTYQNWGESLDTPRLDYIFATRGFDCMKYHTVTSLTLTGEYPSDHFPLVAELLIRSDM